MIFKQFDEPIDTPDCPRYVVLVLRVAVLLLNFEQIFKVTEQSFAALTGIFEFIGTEVRDISVFCVQAPVDQGERGQALLPVDDLS